MVNNNRFLILPWVFCKNLGSYLLSRTIQRIAKDWEERYGYPLYLLETFVDRSKFTGACYRASNWLFVGNTAGYAKRLSFYYHGQKKDVYLYPLTAQFREKLCET